MLATYISHETESTYAFGAMVSVGRGSVEASAVNSESRDASLAFYDGRSFSSQSGQTRLVPRLRCGAAYKLLIV